MPGFEICMLTGLLVLCMLKKFGDLHFDHHPVNLGFLLFLERKKEFSDFESPVRESEEHGEHGWCALRNSEVGIYHQH